VIFRRIKWELQRFFKGSRQNSYKLVRVPHRRENNEKNARNTEEKLAGKALE
jgi:hypothetical protein